MDPAARGVKPASRSGDAEAKTSGLDPGEFTPLWLEHC